MKKPIFYIILIGINLIILFIVIYSYLLLVNLNIITSPKFLSNNLIYRKFYSFYFLSKKEKKLLKIMNDNYYDFYPAIELGGDYEHLSKKLFDFPIYDGQKTFIHKSNIKKLMTILPIEKGLSVKKINFSLPFDAKLKNLIFDLVMNNTSKRNLDFFQYAVANYNELGMRINLNKNTKSLPSILFVGDSYTEGLYVNDDETFVHHLGQIMEQEKFGFPINAGCNGYGSINELLIIKKFSQQLKIKTVIMVHSFNDVYNNPKVFYEDGKEISDAWEENFKILKETADYCQKNKIKLIIIPFPHIFQFINPHINSKKFYQKKLLEFCSQNSISFLDIYDDINKIIQVKEARIKISQKGYIQEENETFFEQNINTNLYLPLDDHLSQYGHKMFAQFIWKQLSESNKD